FYMSDPKESTAQSSTHRKSRLRAWLPFILWGVLIFTFSSLPTTPTTEIYWQDFVIKKSAHIIEFFVLTLLLFKALRFEGVPIHKTFWSIVVFGVFYAITDEFHQSFTPGRQPTLRDVLIDTTGILLAVYFLYRLDTLRSKYTNLKKVSVFLNYE
ncbi:VanZ family protein, partial [Patescibacteria group bacterium]